MKVQGESSTILTTRFGILMVMDKEEFMDMEEPKLEDICSLMEEMALV